jgi:AcrR family transcriptional regulator
VDLRVQKTLREIREAFMALSLEKVPDKITVKALCDRALINKATFYAHYDNMNALIEEIEDEFVKQLAGDMDYAALFFDDPEQFILRLYDSFRKIPNSKILLMGSRGWDLLNIIFETLRRSIYKERPETKSAPGIDMALTYIISGFSSVTTKHRRESGEERARQAGRATAAVLREFL